MTVEFNEGPTYTPRTSMKQKTSFITGLIIKTKLVKTEGGAQMVLIALLLVVLALLFLSWNRNPTFVTPEPPTAEEIIP